MGNGSKIHFGISNKTKETQVRPGREGGILNPPVSTSSEVRSMRALMETAIGTTVRVKSGTAGRVITELMDGV